MKLNAITVDMHGAWSNKPYKYQPIDGLLNLKKEDFKCINLLKMLEKVEEDISPAPKGRAKRLMLFFYLIDILNSKNIPFLVKGGLILQYYLKDHARATDDLDILIPNSPDEFYIKAQEAFKNNIYGLDIKISKFSKGEANKDYYFSTFYMRLSISYLGEKIDDISLEGINSGLYNEVSPKQYLGPSIIKDNYSFLGVSIEYIFAEKLLAITSELKRPYKHLVDAYSISQIEIDFNELKRYLNAILIYENEIREKVGININDYEYVIKDDKVFTKSYFLPMIQAGYTINLKEMIKSMNQYMSINL